MRGGGKKQNTTFIKERTGGRIVVLFFKACTSWLLWANGSVQTEILYVRGGCSAFLTTMQSVVWVIFFFFLYCGSFLSLIDCIKKKKNRSQMNLMDVIITRVPNVGCRRAAFPAQALRSRGQRRGFARLLRLCRSLVGFLWLLFSSLSF